MEILAATAEDEGAIRQLLEASGLPTADLAPALLEHFLVLREGSVLAAVVGLEPGGDCGLLRSLAVSDAARRRGLGRRLAAAAEARALEMGMARLYLLTTTARDYFTQLGYRLASRDEAPEAIRRTAQFSGLCPSSSWFMCKTLEPAA